MNQHNKVTQKNRDVLESIVPWGLALLALLTAIGAITRMLADTEPDVLKRLDHTTLLYLVVAGALLMTLLNQLGKMLKFLAN